MAENWFKCRMVLILFIFKVITPSIVSDRMKIRGSLARRAIKQLHQEGKIKLEIQVRTLPSHFDQGKIWSGGIWLEFSPNSDVIYPRMIENVWLK